MKNALLLTAIIFMTTLTGCSYNISMAHTEGMASDTIDHAPSNTPTFTVPITPGSSLRIGS